MNYVIQRVIISSILRMEEHNSLYICEGLINDCLIPKAYAALPPDNRAIAVFSLKQSAALTESLVVSQDYCPDQPRDRLSEDQPNVTTHKRSIRICPPYPSRPSMKPKLSIFSRSSKISKNRDESVQVASSFNNPKVTPLQTCQDSQHSEEESEDIESRLRQRKIHQQYFRTRYEQNFKQGALKKKGFTNKGEGKGHNIVAYDFDGGVIQSSTGKQDSVKLPMHFLDLEVYVAEKEDDREQKKKASRAKLEPKRESIRREELKVAQSHFFKDFGGVHWSEGVQLRQSKEQCRKILGYQNPNLFKRKKVDLFKSSDKPIHIKLQDLQSYKNLLSTNSQLFESQQNFHRESEKSMLAHVSSRGIALDQKSKNITITNSRALEFLIQNQFEPDSKKSSFAFGEKRFAKSLHVHY